MQSFFPLELTTSKIESYCSETQIQFVFLLLSDSIKLKRLVFQFFVILSARFNMLTKTQVHTTQKQTQLYQSSDGKLLFSLCTLLCIQWTHAHAVTEGEVSEAVNYPGEAYWVVVTLLKGTQYCFMSKTQALNILN